jgi:hypothetical protein
VYSVPSVVKFKKISSLDLSQGFSALLVLFS